MVVTVASNALLTHTVCICTWIETHTHTHRNTGCTPGMEKITSALLVQPLTDADVGDLLDQHESKISALSHQEAACH